MKIRTAAMEDLAEILKIYETAREYMRRSGNPNQWKNTNPPESTLVNDIHLGQLYVVYEDNESTDIPAGTLLGSFACIGGKDPTYSYIEGGKWLNDEEYLTLHRVASAGIAKKVLDFILADTFKKTRNIRIDTHKDNLTMQHILGRNGFSYCGIIYLANGEQRLAYQKSTD